MKHQQEASLHTKSGKAVALKGITIEADCRGLLFEATVVQHYTNPTDSNLEVIYNFPLPHGAVPLGVHVVLGGKSLSGTVVARRVAETRYEEALAGGDAAIMVDVTPDGGYCMNLGNLAAKEDCTITLRYAQPLRFEQGGLRLMIPTVIAPRYGDPIKAGRFAAHQVPESDLTVTYPFDIAVRLHGDLANTRVASPSHPISVESSTFADESIMTITLARQGALDRDFVLVIDRLAHHAIAVTAPDYANSSKFVTLASLCPMITGTSPSTIAVKILVDCSGSMAGDSMREAMHALLVVINQLGENDRFSLSRFGSTVEHRSRALWPMTPATKLAAKQWVGKLAADLGGTEMEEALTSTIKLGQSAPSDILLVTDGEIHGIDALINTAAQSQHRVFVVGIGSSPAQNHLRRLAEATGGGCDFVASGEAVQPAILRMFARLRSPRFTDLQLIWPEGTAINWSTPVGTAVFTGDTLNLFAWSDQAPRGMVRLLGRAQPDGESVEIAAASIHAPCDSQALPRLAADAKLRILQQAPQTKAVDEAALTELAVAYQLVTPFTNFVLVHERAEGEKADEMPGLINVAQMVPAGWGGTGTVLRESMQDLNVANFAASYDLNRPCVMRNPRSLGSGAKRKRDNTLTEHYDIPAFLRRQAEPVLSLCDDVDYPREVDHDKAAFWNKDHAYGGLTPLGVAELLRINPPEFWPARYSECSDTGLGRWVLDWLEYAIGQCGAQPIDEKIVVAAFNYVMGQPETYRYLQRQMSREQWSDSLIASLADKHRAHHPAMREEAGKACATRIVSILADMQPQAWPDQVIELSKDAC